MTQYRIADLQTFLDNQKVTSMRIRVCFTFHFCVLRCSTVPGTKQAMFVDGKINNLKNN